MTDVRHMHYVLRDKAMLATKTDARQQESFLNSATTI